MRGVKGSSPFHCRQASYIFSYEKEERNMFQRLVRGANKVARFAVNNSSTILIGVATTGFVAVTLAATTYAWYKLGNATSSGSNGS